MNILFVHQNFPGQYRYLASTLATDKRIKVVGLGEVENVKKNMKLPGVTACGYPAPGAATPQTHHYVKPLESAVRRGQAVARACMGLKEKGFVPDIIYAHPGWGEALFLKDVFPNAKLTLYCEFYYRNDGADVGFDPEFPSKLDDMFRVRIKNAASLLSLEAGDRGISPTQWQRDAFPAAFRDRITVIHEGVDTDYMKPDAEGKASVTVAERKLTLTADDEVVTYIARNLEPYRGFHSFMRALPSLLKQRPNAQVLIVGGEGVSYGQSLPKGQTYKKKMLAEVGNQLDLDRVHFLPPVPYETLLRIYQISSTHVYLTYPFVLSWSMLEAMSSGCTLVASDTAPVREVIRNGKNGYLTDFFDAEKLAEKVAEVVENRKSKEVVAIRTAARRTVVENYDLRRVCLPKHLQLLGFKGAKTASRKA